MIWGRVCIWEGNSALYFISYDNVNMRNIHLLINIEQYTINTENNARYWITGIQQRTKASEISTLMEFYFSTGQDSKQNKDIYVKEIRRKRTSKIVVEMTGYLNNLFSITLAATKAL